ncbi:hemerythrin domain-containing protein [Streptomyces radicis]|uniref:Hemerythrin domain-containing protein n=1 Tax=Streptomyces radicis TaxID=1750517 RepID=A0A3A9VTU8_9ACTN|nr:hemerythrin domain-containing protein [Streptomyces radicis]RKN04318.1 hemerythrin domain-containing protein [Streptomyces radicis]RKN14825.1 hemerythrin domain-containing protein [Streptomyces radicis]
MGHGGDIIHELTTDHREVAELFSDIESMPPGEPRRKRLADQVTIELVRHSIAEEQYLYPAVRAQVPEGDAIADREIGDHATAERIMKELEEYSASHARFDQLVARLMIEVREHIQDEEDHLFPMLRAACTPEALADLGDKARRAKRMAPTRPHPSAPDTPPLNKVLAPGIGLVDRARDMISGRGRGS